MRRTVGICLSIIAAACTTERDSSSRPDSSGAVQAPAARASARGAGPTSTTDTVVALWSDSTPAPDGSISVSRGRVITVTVATSTRTIDSTWVIPAPVKPIGLPFGIWQTPLDSICKTGYSSALVPVRDSAPISAALDRAKRCGLRLVLQLPGNFSRDPVKGGLSVKVASAALAKWPWAKVCAAAADSSVLAAMEGDDLTHEQWDPNPPASPIPTATRIAMWDSIWGYTHSRCPGLTVAARFRPTQLEPFPKAKNLDALLAQYTGPRRHGQPSTFFGNEVASAKRQGYGLIFGLNILNGGCGPASTGKCLSGIPGTSAVGADGLYQMSAAELKAYGSVIIGDPYSCAFLSWAYGYGSDLFTKAANRAALDSLSERARKRAPASCNPR